ncbi:MAG: pyruvate dehydrogenase complex dihydrolipoamide acetyltransferase [Bacteroidota bacterium]
MAEIVRMPKLSDTMEEGVVAEWHKNVGDEVESGELLAEIETDKATMEFESFQDGVLLYIGVEKGKAAPVDSVLCILGEKGEDFQSLLDAEASAPSVQEEEVKPEVKSEPATPAKPLPSPAPVTAPSPQPIAQPVALVSESNGRIKASPLAKKLAAEKGINIALVQGSGELGRVIKRDIENYTGNSMAPAFVGVESFREEPVSQMRKVIAKRLAESKFTAPHFYLTIEMNMDAAMEGRKVINTQIAPNKVSFNDLVIKAAAKALKKHPKVNSAWLGDRIRYNDHVNIGVAVAVDEGLLVPVVRFADGKTLTQIGNEVREYAGKAKAKKLQPEDWEGNTFTISNLGMFGIEEFTAIVNPPDACILAVGTIVQKPVVKDGQIVVGHTMKVTLSCDHRVVDGAVGSAFLKTFRTYMENPLLLLGEASI